MIDFDKAEFLNRLDVRFAAFSALLEMHEKYIISLCESRKVFKDATKAVEKHHREIHKFIEETDKKIFDFFENAKRDSHGEWIGTEYDGYADGNPVYDKWECSKCHEEFSCEGEPPPYNYCPNCGAKMDGKRRYGNER